MLTATFNTSDLPRSELVRSYFSVHEEAFGSVIIAPCTQQDKQYANVRVFHSRMHPGSADEARACLTSRLHEELIERGVILCSAGDGESLNTNELNSARSNA